MPEMVNLKLFIFSISCDMEKMKICLRKLTISDSVILLSPHRVFKNEQNDLLKGVSARVVFYSFADFISEKEMISCDVDADINLLKSSGYRLNKLKNYYNEIKRLKNRKILENIKNAYPIESLYLFSEDLGIDRTEICSHASKVYDCTGNKSIFKKPIYLKLKKIGKLFRKIRVSKLTAGGQHYYSIGNESRVMQYLAQDEVTYSEISVSEYVIILALYYISFLGRLNERSYKVLFRYCAIVIARCGQKLKIFEKIAFLTTIHEYKDEIGLLAQNAGVSYVNIQDGYLPSIYPSRYLLYRPAVTKYFCWDKQSSDIFRYHGLDYEVWSAFKPIKPVRNDVEILKNPKRVLFLTSGAGDWTALKNRSDEDDALISFVDLAKSNPEIEFVYRPHPMWVHQEHQGVLSIQRVEEFIKWSSLPNLCLSMNIKADSTHYRDEDNLSLRYNSIETEISDSDIVFGDHSQALFTALMNNKIIAGVDRSNRLSFLSGHQNKGLPVLRSLEEMQNFLDLCKEDGVGVMNALKEKLISV